ncbi:Platelet-derived growth factor receptor-like protein [Heterocephalus glaber]|uniref:Platelet-derived growth factor receptor-like protein n=1 Tax=Heterocephalus glaber TaxID=10181 RepID=G5C137_HETGA|nr:Platelet-derived growth factor receptor-like protein [Heterocephalus glaber]
MPSASLARDKRSCQNNQGLLVNAIAAQHLPKNKQPKEQGENRIKPTNKKVKPKVPKIKDRDTADSTPKSQSIMMQVTEKGRFQRPAATLSLAAGQTVELRCKGSKIGWSYPAYLDTFKDSRLRMKGTKGHDSEDSFLTLFHEL